MWCVMARRLTTRAAMNVNTKLRRTTRASGRESAGSICLELGPPLGVRRSPAQHLRAWLIEGCEPDVAAQEPPLFGSLGEGRETRLLASLERGDVTVADIGVDPARAEVPRGLGDAAHRVGHDALAAIGVAGVRSLQQRLIGLELREEVAPKGANACIILRRDEPL